MEQNNVPKTYTNVDPKIDKFENEYSELSEEFKNLQQEQYKIFAYKMLSYGLGNIAVGSKLETEEEKQLSLTSIWIRQFDKINRLKQLVVYKKDNPLEDEPIEDAWKDLSVYSLIALIVKANKWKK